MAGDMELGRMKISVALDDKEFNRSIAKFERSIRGGVRQFSSFSSAVRRGGQELAVHQAKLRMLSNSIQNMSKVTDAYGKRLNDSALMSRYTAKEQDNLRVAYEQSQAKLAAYKNEFTTTAKQMAVLQTKTTGITGSMYKLGTGATTLGSTLTRNVTLPLGAIGAYALKTGFDFEAGMSRVQAIAGASKSEMKQLTDQALDLGQKTAFSASQIASGMENLASAGFSTNEILKAMPGLLDLAAVSGGDVAAASDVAASTLRAFNLEADQSGHLADVFAKAAADTNAEVGDMGEAMKYAAPVAHQLGMSVEETAAAIGVMADNGIKGTQAGTTLRGALTRLAKPTAAMSDVMQQYGLSFFDAQGKMLPFGKILGQLQSKLGKADEKTRVAALTTLFGKEALSGMMALVGTAPGKYDNLTGSLKNANGAADKMARTMQDNAKAAIEQMMGSLETTAIKVTGIVAPTIKDLAKLVGDLADAFSNLDPSAQRLLVNLGMLAIVAGPTLSIFGKLTTGSINMIAAFKGMRAGQTAAQTIAGLGTAAGSTAGKMGTLGLGAGKAAGLIGALGPVGLGTIGVLGLLGGGLVFLNKKFKDDRFAARWGEGINSGAARALDGVQNAQQGISQALSKTADEGRTKSKEVSDAFAKLADSVEKTAGKTNAALDKTFKQYPKEVQGILDESYQREKKANDGRVDEANRLAKEVENIEKQKGKTTLEQQTFINNARQRMNEIAVKTAGLTRKQEKQALAALNDDINQMSSKSRHQALADISDTLEKTDSAYDKSRKNIKKMFDSGVIDFQGYKDAIKALDDQHDKATSNMIARMYALMKKNGQSTEEMDFQFRQLGYTLDEAKTAYDNMANGADKSMGAVIDSTGKMSKKTRDAVNQWNGLVFDEKEGKVKSDAVQVVAEAMKSGKSWNSMVLAAKQAKVGSNARKIFMEAAIDSGKWNDLSIPEKEAIINSNVGTKIATDKATIDSFNKLPVADKKIITTSNTPEEIQKSLESVGLWDSISAPIKKLITQSNAPMVTDKSKGKIDGWNKVKPAVKKLLTEDYSTDNFKNAIKSQKDWNAQPADVKKLLANNANAKQALNEAGIKVGEYNAKKTVDKKLNGNATGVNQASNSARGSLEAFNKKPVHGKHFKGEASNVNKASSQARGNVEAFDKKKPYGKQFKGNASSVVGASSSARGSVSSFNSHRVSPKHFNGNAKNVQSASKSGRTSLGEFNSFTVKGKKIKAKWYGGSVVETAKSSLASIKDKLVNIFVKTKQKRAGGDPSFMGGPVTVNDQSGSLYKELLVKPSGQEMLLSGRDREVNLPAGTTIFNASDTSQILAARRNMDQVTQLTKVGKNDISTGADPNVIRLLEQLNRTSGQGLMETVQAVMTLVKVFEKTDNVQSIFGDSSPFEQMDTKKQLRDRQRI